jgi:hypothetical protein
VRKWEEIRHANVHHVTCAVAEVSMDPRENPVIFRHWSGAAVIIVGRIVILSAVAIDLPFFVPPAIVTYLFLSLLEECLQPWVCFCQKVRLDEAGQAGHITVIFCRLILP